MTADAAERDRIIAYIESRAAGFARHGTRRTATHLRVIAGDLRAGLHVESEKEGTSDGC